MNFLKFTLCFILLISGLVSSCQSRYDGKVKDPGERGKSSVAGIDVDEDGVRDDIQVWIEKEFQDNELIQKAVKEMAKTHPASCDFKLKAGCLESIVGFDETLRVEIKLMELILNTPARQKDFEDKLRECQFSEELTQQKCPFKL